MYHNTRTRPKTAISLMELLHHYTNYGNKQLGNYTCNTCRSKTLTERETTIERHPKKVLILMIQQQTSNVESPSDE